MPFSIPFVLLTGFLGCGKTTLLSGLLCAQAGVRRIAVIENEFANSSIDARDSLVTKHALTVVELNNGSVFCACLLPEFFTACENIATTYAPDVLVLEATGLADPIEVARVMRKPPLDRQYHLHKCICIVDALSFMKMEPLVQRIGHQVRVADIVLVNKVDLVDTTMVNSIVARIRELSPFCTITPTTFCAIEPGQIFDPVDTPAAQRIPETTGSVGRPPVRSAVVRCTLRVDADRLRAFLLDQATAWRIKGFVNIRPTGTLAVQYASGVLDMHPINNYSGPTELIALGPDIDPVQFEKYFFDLF